MTAKLTELKRKPGTMDRSVSHGKWKLTITEHGQPCVQMLPISKINRKQALATLRAIGPVPMPRRK